jgi:hypothetical protein
MAGHRPRIDETVRLTAAKLTSGLPYDVVIPARLDIDPCFGQAVWLNTALEKGGRAFVAAAQLDRPGTAPRIPAPVTAVELEDLRESHSADDPEDEAKGNGR